MMEGMRIRVVRVFVYGSETVSVPTYVGFDSDALNFNRVAHYLPLHDFYCACTRTQKEYRTGDRYCRQH